MVIAASLAASMMMNISSMYGSTLAIGPAHCDRPGWPSCYSVGYDAGKGMSGPCPQGHSLEFCRGWNDATNSGGSSPVMHYVIWRYNSGYNHGWQQAQDDWNGGQYTWLSGGNNVCSVDHTSSYCAGFHDGYAKLWSTMVYTYIQLHRPQFQYPVSPQLLNYSTKQLPNYNIPQQSQNYSTPKPPAQNYSTPQPPAQNYSTPQPPQPQPQPSSQCGLGQAIGSDGMCHYGAGGIIKACLDHLTTCTSLFHILGALF